MLNDYVTNGGTIQVDGTANGSGAGATLELQHTTIDGGDKGSFHIDGLLKADTATANIIENFDAANFTNDGELLVDRRQQPAAAQRHARRLHRPGA